MGEAEATLQVVFLHGRMMSGDDLAPFGHSIGVPARFIFPSAPLAVEPRGRSWWPIDSELRARQQALGPMDLHTMQPAGREQARDSLHGLCEALGGNRKCALVGFSQGGMLAMDYVLHGGCVDFLALLSSSRIAFDEWTPRLGQVKGLSMLVAHGRNDTELAFSAGEGLRDAALTGGADLEWLPFDGGHDIPLVVWRALRRQFLHLLG